MIPGNVLHVGTATGRVSHYFTSKCVDYVGIEISHVMAKITKTNLNGVGDIVRGDAEYLPFRDGAFDNVVCVRSFHFLPHPKQFLSQVYNILKPAGRAIVSFEKRIPGRLVFERLRFLPTPGLVRNYYLNSEVSRLVESAGFEPIFRGNVTRLPLLVYWRLNHDSILRKVHDKIPRWLGTVGVVVGQKSMFGFPQSSSRIGERTLVKAASEQHYYKISDVEDLFREAGFQVKGWKSVS